MNTDFVTIRPGRRIGRAEVPPSKSHLHRLLIADFLGGGRRYALPLEGAEDIRATRRCLTALAANAGGSPTLACGESGSTLRFMLPVALLCADDVLFTAEGRLPERPISPFLELLARHGVHAPEPPVFPLRLTGSLQPGEYAVRGDISSQIVTGLLFALPRLPGDSVIRYLTPLQSGGYVEMTLQVLEEYGIAVGKTRDGLEIPGRQTYRLPAAFSPEKDWSAAAFWLAMNALGSRIEVPGLAESSRQPDRQMAALLRQMGGAPDVSQCPDIFPVLAVVAAATPAVTRFTGVRRLRLKESDRIAAMETMLQALGVATDVGEDTFTVHGKGTPLKGDVTLDSFNDHRIAMSAAVAATVADAPVRILSPGCTAKSYPAFFTQFEAMGIL